jgi:hypothetical protein
MVGNKLEADALTSRTLELKVHLGTGGVGHIFEWESLGAQDRGAMLSFKLYSSRVMLGVQLNCDVALRTWYCHLGHSCGSSIDHVVQDVKQTANLVMWICILLQSCRAVGCCQA